MNIPGLKDLRTTLPAAIAAASAFIIDNQDLFDPSRTVDLWILKLARFCFYGGLVGLGVNAASSKKVIQKTEERLQDAGLPPKDPESK